VWLHHYELFCVSRTVDWHADAGRAVLEAPVDDFDRREPNYTTSFLKTFSKTIGAAGSYHEGGDFRRHTVQILEEKSTLRTTGARSLRPWPTTSTRCAIESFRASILIAITLYAYLVKEGVGLRVLGFQGSGRIRG